MFIPIPKPNHWLGIGIFPNRIQLTVLKTILKMLSEEEKDFIRLRETYRKVL